MIQDNFTLSLCLLFLVLSFIIFQYNEVTKTKKASLIHLELVNNQITKEKKKLVENNKEVVKIDELEKITNQKLTTLKTDIMLIDFTFCEIFKSI
jgi:hypothetical protein